MKLIGKVKRLFHFQFHEILVVVWAVITLVMEQCHFHAMK